MPDPIPITPPSVLPFRARIYFDAQVADRAFQLAVAEQELNGPKSLRGIHLQTLGTAKTSELYGLWLDTLMGALLNVQFS